MSATCVVLLASPPPRFGGHEEGEGSSGTVLNQGQCCGVPGTPRCSNCSEDGKYVPEPARRADKEVSTDLRKTRIESTMTSIDNHSKELGVDIGSLMCKKLVNDGMSKLLTRPK